jgi:hypothetical protein
MNAADVAHRNCVCNDSKAFGDALSRDERLHERASATKECTERSYTYVVHGRRVRARDVDANAGMMNFFETPRQRICARDVSSSRRANRIARRPRASRRVLFVARNADVARRASRATTRRRFADSRAHRDTSRHAKRRFWGHFLFICGDAREER